jgi:transposase
MKMTTVGLDLAKNVFQVHAMNEHGKAVLRKQLSRDLVAAFFANLPGPRRHGGLRQRSPLGAQAA